MMMVLVYVRIATASVIIAIQVVPTPEGPCMQRWWIYKVGLNSSRRLKSRGIVWNWLCGHDMASSLNAEEKLWLRTQS